MTFLAAILTIKKCEYLWVPGAGRCFYIKPGALRSCSERLPSSAALAFWFEATSLCITMYPGRSWTRLAVYAVLCLALILIWVSSPSEGAIYYGQGKCKHKDKIFKPGQKFQRGCDKCYCEEEGYFCITPMRPTSWPKKCKPVYMNCSYRIVYRSHPEKDCRAYSWVG